MPDLGKHVVVVTGAGSGIGREVVTELLAAGARVLAVDRDPESLGAYAGDEAVLTAALDVTDEAAVGAAFAAARERFGCITGLVNAAGVVVSGPFLEFTFEHWDRTFRVNTWGTYVTIKAAVPHLRDAGGGSIVNFSSSGGKIPNPNTAPYAASKLAVISLTRSAAGELAPDIRVNAVVPGIVDTPMWAQLDREYAAREMDVSMRSRAAITPMGRPAKPDDIAAVVLFLLSDESRFVTGEDLNVSGGQVMF